MKPLLSLLFSGFAFCLFSFALNAQIPPGVYMGGDTDDMYLLHEVKINENYLIHTSYKPKISFISTVGGFYTFDANSLKVDLEFNSNYAKDSLQTVSYGYEMSGDTLVLKGKKTLTLVQTQEINQDLDGTWLFATRGPDTGQERRGDSSPRKTLKFLMDGHFQWIAYNTETMQFSGSGGGRYTAKDAKYTEIILYFSRDVSRMGAVLEFNYERKGDDWHHTGKNSRGEPMYEIWSLRN